MSTSTLLLGLAQTGVTGRLWNKSWQGNEPPASFDDSVGYPGVWDVRGTTPDEQSLGFQNVPAGPARVWLRAPGYEDQKFDTTMPDDGAKEIRLVRAPISLSPLNGIAGHRFTTTNGGRVFGKMTDAFLLYKRYLDGQDITPQLTQVRDLGFNMIRVMGMFESLGGFDPKVYGARYYDSIPDFCRLCEASGQYVYWVCCAATQGIFATDDQVSWHIQETVAHLRGVTNTLCSWVNEQGQHNNSINRDRIKADVDMGALMYDSGSFGVDEACQPPFGTHAVLHSRGDFPASVKDMAAVDQPNVVHDGLQCFMDEPGIRFGADGKGDGCTDPQRAADCAGTAFTALGWCFHSLQGERGDVLSGNTLDCAIAASAAMEGF